MTDRLDDMTPEMSPDEALALDYALGALGREARRAVEARLRSDPGFRALVETWQASLAPLDEDTAAVAPPAALWDRIAEELEPTPRPRVVAATPKRGFWESLAVWRGLAIGASTAAAVALALVVMPRPAGPPAPPVGPAAPTGGLLAARLASPDGNALLAATWDPARGTIVLTPAGEAEHAGKSPELWVIEPGQAPRSLGVIDLDGAQAHAIPRERIAGLKPGSTLAISLEPRGGSPTGAPTGPVVATGTLTSI